MSGLGVRVDVNEEVKLLCKLKKKIGGGGGGLGVGRIRLCRVRGGSGWSLTKNGTFCVIKNKKKIGGGGGGLEGVGSGEG